MQETKKIRIEDVKEVLEMLRSGRVVDGRLALEETDDGRTVIVFKAYNRKNKQRKPDKMLCPLESGWLKESAQRYKFYSSVKKDVGKRLVSVAMHRDLEFAMETLDFVEFLKELKDDENPAVVKP